MLCCDYYKTRNIPNENVIEIVQVNVRIMAIHW